MTVRTKSSLILLSTLLLGILIGAIGMDYYKDRTRIRIKDFRERSMFMGLHEQILQPRSESQADSIKQVLNSYFPKFRAFQEKHQEEIQAILDSLQHDLGPILTPEQLERLNRRREGKGRMMPPGPPPFGPGEDPGMMLPGDRPDRMPPEFGPGRMPRGDGPDKKRPGPPSE